MREERYLSASTGAAPLIKKHYFGEGNLSHEDEMKAIKKLMIKEIYRKLRENEELTDYENELFEPTRRLISAIIRRDIWRSMWEK